MVKNTHNLIIYTPNQKEAIKDEKHNEIKHGRGEAC